MKKRERGLTTECFERLLDWLGPDRDAAAAKYEKIRRRLIQIFVSRGSSEPEDLTDRTIDRVCEKVEEVVDGYSGDPALYFYGVANKIYFESTRPRPSPRRIPQPIPDPDKERRYECLEKCMANLSAETRAMVLDYYREDGMARIENHKAMAEELSIRVETLRLRVHRIRMDLRECVKACMSQSED